MRQPIKVSGVDIAFGARSKMKELLPSISEIPEDFFQLSNKWNKLVSDWFYYGLQEVKYFPKEGINTNDAIRHVKAIIGSYEPKHEHKIAGCAYLLSEFFENIDYEKGNIKS